MKIEKVEIKGIKSHESTSFTLEKYSTFIGQNNSGKSNTLSAIRWFSGDLKLNRQDVTYNYEGDISVRVTFSFEDGEDISSYGIDADCISENRFKIEGYRSLNDLEGSAQLPKYRYLLDNDEIKNATKPNFIEIIYVPAIKKLDDELKFTNKSTINKLVSKYVINTVESTQQYREQYELIASLITTFSNEISTGEQSAFGQLKASLDTYMLEYDNLDLDFRLNPPNLDELIKNSFSAFVKRGDEELPFHFQGMGFQRSLIFSLICSMTDITESNNLTLFLIEEPELFLHPNHQTHFRNKLIDLSNIPNNQILLTSHSPYFVNNIENYSQIKVVSLNNNVSKVKEIEHAEIDSICQTNGQLMAEAHVAHINGNWQPHELIAKATQIADEDELRYLLWMDPIRANVFFSKKVILVEGPTEKAFLSFILNNQAGDLYGQETSDIAVIDVVGKYHFYKFANLLNHLDISTWIIYDGDNDAQSRVMSHQKLNQYIVQLKTDNIIVDCLRLNPSLEEHIGLTKDRNKPDISIYKKLMSNEDNCRDCSEYNEIIQFVSGIIIS